MILVKLKVNRTITSAYWKEQAIGTIDEYGNPFRIIRLRWNTNKLHLNAEYTKTRGFEDAVIGSDGRTGNIKITYRQNGSIMWERPAGGIGPFNGELAQTPFNMDKLAAHYGDKLWTILDADINEQVKAMYEERQKKTPKELQEFNQKRIGRMHTYSLERDDGKAPELPLDADKVTLQEQKRQNEVTRQDNAKRKAELDQREKDLDKRVIDMVGDGAAPVVYSEESLRAKEMKIFKVRKICTQLGVSWANEDKKDDLVKKILEKQAGNAQVVAEKMAGVIGDGLID